MDIEKENVLVTIVAAILLGGDLAGGTTNVMSLDNKKWAIKDAEELVTLVRNRQS
ncbi:hypothetical protein LCGC14_0220410 [marine sediment metagenome]|uniref:Uncharacterized protein n=1 Tax=marine sediment metagenome TaxID=412755 RepID=A0A0F9UDB1_9ZZZZ